MKTTFAALLAPCVLVSSLFAGLSAAAQAQTMNDAVYQGLGAKSGISKIVADFLPIILADQRINAAFKDTDMERLGAMLAEQFCELSGGPCKYSGKEMKEAHQDMKVTNAQFFALAEDLQIAMEKNNIPSSVQNKLVAKLAPMQRPIVTK
ncbi:group I truncated hemoglobin [Undibacterium sp. SXout7W]|uniref:group I truncated hemoglobin n=1 Tax=Undibacterium sp. SXout7W TaxID=3413049 RepID=UPI003BF43B0D